MPTALLSLFAWCLSTSVVAASRPATTFAALQLLLMGKLYAIPWLGEATGWWSGPWWELPAVAAWVVSPPAVVVGLGLAAGELFVHHGSSGLRKIWNDNHLQLAATGIGCFSSLILLVLLRAPVSMVEDAAARADTQVIHVLRTGQDGATAQAAPPVAAPPVPAPVASTQGSLPGQPPAEAAPTHSSFPAWQSLLLLAFGNVIGLLGAWLRKAVYDVLNALYLDGLASWIESGGVLVFLALLPVVAAAVAVVAVFTLLAAAVGVVAARGAVLALDRTRRRPCPVCRTAIRVEASLCPACGAAVEPAVWLRRGLLGTVRRERVVEAFAIAVPGGEPT